ncbi:VTT domain-containing protein [Deltaproteobacteria bacterium]|nr:VTT domain-containing protein [Deltaproteobacteria bacterium]
MSTPLKLGLLLAFLAAILCLYASGAHGVVDAEALQTWIGGAGAWGAVAFVAVYALLQPLGVRSVFFLLSAPLIWSPVEAVLLSWIGAVVASVIAFGFARFVARDWAQARAPTRIRKLDDRLAQDGFRVVTLLRLVFYTTPALQFALGVSRVRFRAFLSGTIVGVLPFTLLMTLFGTQASAFFWGLLS